MKTVAALIALVLLSGCSGGSEEKFDARAVDGTPVATPPTELLPQDASPTPALGTIAPVDPVVLPLPEPRVTKEVESSTVGKERALKAYELVASLLQKYQYNVDPVLLQRDKTTLKAEDVPDLKAAMDDHASELFDRALRLMNESDGALSAVRAFVAFGDNVDIEFKDRLTGKTVSARLDTQMAQPYTKKKVSNAVLQIAQNQLSLNFDISTVLNVVGDDGKKFQIMYLTNATIRFAESDDAAGKAIPGSDLLIHEWQMKAAVGTTLKSCDNCG